MSSISLSSQRAPSTDINNTGSYSANLPTNTSPPSSTINFSNGGNNASNNSRLYDDIDPELGDLYSGIDAYR